MKMIMRRNTVPILENHSQYSINSTEASPVSESNKNFMKSRKTLKKEYVMTPKHCSQCWTQEFFISNEFPFPSE